MRCVRFGLLGLFLSLAPHAASATSYLVCPDGSGDFPDIESCFEKIAAGDTCQLCPGTFGGWGNRDLEFPHRPITVRGDPAHPELYVIDCGGSYGNFHRGFSFSSGQGPGSVLEGITITRGWAPRGPSHYSEGGAILCWSSSPSILNCVLRGDTAWGGVGDGEGGALACYDSSPVLVGCTFSDDHTVNYGGGVLSMDSSPAFTDCSFNNNSSVISGGAAGILGGSATFTRCTFSGSSVNDGGGGIVCSGASLTLANCTISDNYTLFSTGGGIYFGYGSSVVLMGCTVAHNEASGGGGIHASGTSTLSLDRTILWRNCVHWGGAGEELLIDEGASGESSCSCVDSSGIDGSGTIVWGPGNIFTDPLFCEGGYGLQDCSPCVDAPGCGQIGSHGIECPCEEPTATVPTSWGRVKDLLAKPRNE